MTKLSPVSVLEIDLDAVLHNLHYFKSKLQTHTKVLAVVKAFSYGLDAVTIARFLEKNKVDYLAVAYAAEGVALRKAGVQLPVLVLHPQVPNFQTLIDYQLEPNLYSFYTLDAFVKIAKKNHLKDYPTHLKFNTGLNRLGFKKEDLSQILEVLKDSACLKIQSVFSHLAASEDASEKEFTKNQIDQFSNLTTQLQKQLDYRPILHLSNTSGVLNYAEGHFDMVRLGIGLYGFGNTPEETSNLKNVGSLKSIISQIHVLEKGTSLGYNRAFVAVKTTRTATIPVGHADGISRSLGNGVGSVQIHHQKCAILGNVCMDMLLVDVTEVPCKEGDPVVLFDSQETVEEWAEKSNTISYEILTGISQRIPRKIKGDS